MLYDKNELVKISSLVVVGLIVGAISSVLALLLTNDLQSMQGFLTVGFRIAIFAVLITTWILAVLRTNQTEKVLSDVIFKLVTGFGTFIGTLTYFFPVYVALGLTGYDSVGFVREILRSSILYLFIAIVADLIFPRVYRIYCLYQLKKTE